MASSPWHARDPHLHILVYLERAVITPMAGTARTSQGV
jgi:hypothetical protein